MTLRATQREAQPDRTDGVDAIQHIVHARFLRIASALTVRHVIAVKRSRQLLLWRGIWQKVPSELL